MSSNQVKCDCSKVNANICNRIVSKNIRFVGLTKEQGNFLKDTKVWAQENITGRITLPDEKVSMKSVNVINCTFRVLSSRIILTPAIYDKQDDGNYDIKSVSNFEGEITTGKKLVVEGATVISVRYASDTPNGNLVDFEDFIPFSMFMTLPSDADLNDIYEVKYSIDDVVIKELCERSISLSMILTLKANKLEDEAAEVAINDVENNRTNILSINGNIKNSSGGSNTTEVGRCRAAYFYSNEDFFQRSNDYSAICAPQKDITGTATTDEVISFLKDTKTSGEPQMWQEFSIFSQVPIELPCKDVKDILNVNSEMECFCKEIIDTAQPVNNEVENAEGLKLTGKKLIVQGVLYQYVNYIGDSEDNSIHSVNMTIPFSSYIILDNSKNDVSSNSNYKLSYLIEDIYMEALKEREIFQNTTIFIKAIRIS